MVTTIDQKLAELITEKLTINGWPIGNLVLCVGALLLSVILCGLIGVEREWRGRSAGLRTHLLVGVGSCLIMIISIYGFPAMFGEKRDVARLAAQIITGVGFLGAGVIMHRNGGVKGLTTAGTIWAVMAIGIACGSFNFILALVGTLIIFIVLTVFKAVEAKLNKRNPIIILTVPSNEPALTKILAIAEKFECSIHGVSSQLGEEQGQEVLEITFQVMFDNGGSRLDEFVSAVEAETKAIRLQTLGHR
jgi:putative Mg2+ transporter-C (MgtC) family protein